MKKPGAAWRVKNAESMIAIRICRANAGWGDFWDARMAAQHLTTLWFAPATTRRARPRGTQATHVVMFKKCAMHNIG